MTCSLRSSSTSRQTGHLGGLYSRSRYLSSSAAVYSHFKTSVFNARLQPSTVAGPRLHLRHLQPCLYIKDRTYLPPTNSSVIQKSVVSMTQSKQARKQPSTCQKTNVNPLFFHVLLFSTTVLSRKSSTKRRY